MKRGRKNGHHQRIVHLDHNRFCQLLPRNMREGGNSLRRESGRVGDDNVSDVVAVEKFPQNRKWHKKPPASATFSRGLINVAMTPITCLEYLIIVRSGEVFGYSRG